MVNSITILKNIGKTSNININSTLSFSNYSKKHSLTFLLVGRASEGKYCDHLSVDGSRSVPRRTLIGRFT